jgi:signal peptidase I
VFVMGDNRDRSADSRFGFGVEGKRLEFVPLENIKGRAVVIWLSFSFVDGLRWNRIGQMLWAAALERKSGSLRQA